MLPESNFMLVYKYLNTDVGKRVLSKFSIRFTQPAALNDPFEALWLFDEDLRNETIKTTKLFFKLKFGRDMNDDELEELPAKIDETLLNVPKFFSEEIGFLSLSKEKNISLMWSHYADEHRGIVIGFDSDIFPKDLHDVSYTYIRPTYIQPEIEGTGWKQLLTLLTTKSEHWSYEKEVRSFSRLENAASVPMKIRNYDVCLFSFPPESIKEVIFGWHTPLNERQEIQELAADKYPHAKLFEAKSSSSNFDLDILPL
jgi:hypothetical protein